MKVPGIILFMLWSSVSQSADTCSRIAIIDYQEVLVDTNSTQKGEGLRYHLAKDPKAREYLDRYQEGTQLHWQNAVLGTTGTGLILAGVLSNSSSANKRSLLVGGATLIILNFLVARTMENTNEKNLLNAVEEYNKRNLPKIYFGPDSQSVKGRSQNGQKVYLEKSWGF